MRISISICLATTLIVAPIIVNATAPIAPTLSADSYLLEDMNSGQILAAQNADERREPASLTKLMSTYLIFQALKSGKIKMDQITTVSAHAHAQEGSRTFLETNERISVETLIYGMIVQSGNDATVALAELISGNEPTFVQAMNDEAQILGMTNTHFANATGLNNPNHYSTASDLAKLSAAIIRDFPEYYPFYSVHSFTHDKIVQANRNLLLFRDPSVDGLKTGHTEAAGYCLVASAKRNNRRLLSVVMGTKSSNARAQDSENLLNFGFNAYETVLVLPANKRLQVAPIYKGSLSTVNVGTTKNTWITLPNGDSKALTQQVSLNTPLIAPIEKGKKIGRLTLSLNGKPLETIPLVTLETIAPGSFTKRMKDSIRLMLANHLGIH